MRALVSIGVALVAAAVILPTIVGLFGALSFP